MPHPNPLLRHIFTVRADLANILDVGPSPAGHRRVINILSGTVTGGSVFIHLRPEDAAEDLTNVKFVDIEEMEDDL